MAIIIQRKEFEREYGKHGRGWRKGRGYCNYILIKIFKILRKKKNSSTMVATPQACSRCSRG